MKFSIILLVAVPLVATSVAPDPIINEQMSVQLKSMAASLETFAQHFPGLLSNNYEQVDVELAQVEDIANKLTDLATQLKYEANQPNILPTAYEQEAVIVNGLAVKFDTLASKPTTLLTDFQYANSQLKTLASDLRDFVKQSTASQAEFEDISGKMFKVVRSIEQSLESPYEIANQLSEIATEIGRLSTDPLKGLSEIAQELGNLANNLTKFEQGSSKLAVIPTNMLEKVWRATNVADKLENVAEQLKEFGQSIEQWAEHDSEYNQERMKYAVEQAELRATQIAADFNIAAGKSSEIQNKDG